jgi:hypothetical protein
VIPRARQSAAIFSSASIARGASTASAGRSLVASGISRRLWNVRFGTSPSGPVSEIAVSRPVAGPRAGANTEGWLQDESDLRSGAPTSGWPTSERSGRCTNFRRDDLAGHKLCGFHRLVPERPALPQDVGSTSAPTCRARAPLNTIWPRRGHQPGTYSLMRNLRGRDGACEFSRRAAECNSLKTVCRPASISGQACNGEEH